MYIHANSHCWYYIDSLKNLGLIIKGRYYFKVSQKKGLRENLVCTDKNRKVSKRREWSPVGFFPKWNDLAHCHRFNVPVFLLPLSYQVHITILQLFSEEQNVQMTKHIIQLLRPILFISILLFSLLIGKHSALCLHCFSFRSLETLESSIQKELIGAERWILD